MLALDLDADSSARQDARAVGRRDDLQARRTLAPAMDGDMWTHRATQDNVTRLQRDFGYALVPPEIGSLASGQSGIGRLADLPLIVDAVVTKCIGDGSLRGLNTANIKVYAAQKETVAKNLELMEKGELKLFHIFDLCQGKKNKKEGGCGHHHE